MIVKFTNCKVGTGGGKGWQSVPRRTRNGQNVIIAISDYIVGQYTDMQLRQLFEHLKRYTVLTSSQTKVIRNFNSRDFRMRIRVKRRLKQELNESIL